MIDFKLEKYSIIVAGGAGTRMGAEVPKQFLLLKGMPILAHTLFAFSHTHIILVLPVDQISYWDELCKIYSISTQHTIVKGGATRYQSVHNGLELVPPNSLVAIHDGVRPLITKDKIDLCFAEAEQYGNAILAVNLKDSIREQVEKHTESRKRENYFLIQTPQTFRSELIKKAFELGEQPHFTDDASVLEHAGGEIHLIEGTYSNIKITTPEDLKVAEVLMG